MTADERKERRALIAALKAAASAIQDELAQCDPEEIADHPILNSHAKTLARVRAVIAKSEAARG